MKDLIDIHSHILPGVDDGAETFETSLRMLKCAAADGISAVILTPHNKPGRWRVSASDMESEMKILRDMASERNISIELYVGSELYYRNGLLEELESGTVQTLAGSRYVLVEFNPLADYEYIRNGIYLLRTGGYYPVMAHVERYRNIFAEKYGVEDLIDMGCYIQVNAGSVTGHTGQQSRRFVKKLLNQGQAHFVATDAHDLGKRAPCLFASAEFIRKRWGEAYCRRLFFENPSQLLKDKEIIF